MTDRPSTRTLDNRPYLFILFVLLSISIALLTYVIIQYKQLPEQSYYGVTNNDTRFILSSIDKPNIQNKSLLRWATLAATAAFTFDWVNYEDSLKELKNYFTAQSYDNLITSFENSGYFEKLAEKKFAINAVPVEPAIILQKGEIDGWEMWEIGLKLNVSYRTLSETKSQVKQLVMVVSRVPTRDASTGIGIVQFTVLE
ncbi:MAG: icmL dotI [Francisellaceae bacterium]|nr:icmL dotI [Francisellaceae bacterium]